MNALTIRYGLPLVILRFPNMSTKLIDNKEETELYRKYESQ
jgi:hypothetical protein